MKRVKILDCTLRDGGFVNNWNFGYLAIRDILRRLDLTGVHFIEVGFLRNYVEYDKNKSLFSGTADID